MNPLVVYRLASYYRSSGMALLASYKEAFRNQQRSNKFKEKKQ